MRETREEKKERKFKWQNESWFNYSNWTGFFFIHLYVKVDENTSKLFAKKERAIIITSEDI